MGVTEWLQVTNAALSLLVLFTKSQQEYMTWAPAATGLTLLVWFLTGSWILLAKSRFSDGLAPHHGHSPATSDDRSRPFYPHIDNDRCDSARRVLAPRKSATTPSTGSSTPNNLVKQQQLFMKPEVQEAEFSTSFTLEPHSSFVLQPETRPISHEQLVTEVKGVYAGLVKIETKCINVEKALSESLEVKLTKNEWQALIALHRTLLNEHHEFFLASQHPAAKVNLCRLASKYAMPARMWRHGIYSFLEILRHRLPGSHEHMLTFIYLAYAHVGLLYETVPNFEDAWIECLGVLGRYRMAIEVEDNDFKNPNTRNEVTQQRGRNSDCYDKFIESSYGKPAQDRLPPRKRGKPMEPDIEVPPCKRVKPIESDIEDDLARHDTESVVLRRHSEGFYHLACPYYFRNPGKYPSCIMKHDLESIEDVIHRLQNHHTEPPYCPRCLRSFGNQKERDRHFLARTCEFRQSGPQQRLLKKRDKLSLYESKPWHRIWETVFPKELAPQYAYLTSGIWNVLPLVQYFWERQITNPLEEYVQKNPQKLFFGFDPTRNEQGFSPLGQWPEEIIGEDLSWEACRILKTTTWVGCMTATTIEGWMVLWGLCLAHYDLALCLMVSSREPVGEI